MREIRPEFISPDFVENSDPSILQERMMKNLPADISDMPGDFPYDFTMPSAIEISQFIQFQLVRALMIAFPEYAWDEWLDLHGGQAHVTRHEATRAFGSLEITGETGTVLDAGTIFCVPATDTQPNIEFRTMQRLELTGGTDRVDIQALEPGTGSNVIADTVTMMAKPIKGVISVTNPEPITGGTEQESDDDYYERIHAEYENAQSYVGNDSDYIRWAKEVDGVGDCIVDAAWDGPGTVKLILVDSNGQPANEELQKAVYDHIVSPDDRSERLLPAGDALLTVAAATTLEISYTCTGIVLENAATLEGVKEEFSQLLGAVYTAAKEEGVLRYNDVRPILSDIEGIVDFADFQMNGGYENISLKSEEYAGTKEILFTEAGEG